MTLPDTGPGAGGTETITATDIADRLDRLPIGRLHIIAVLTIGFGCLFEFVELTMTGVFGAVFSADVRAGIMSQTQLALLLAATSVGAAFGSPAYGWVADRFGRRISLSAALLCASLFSFAGAFSNSTEMLIATRLFASFGIGAYMPLAAAYIADIIPPHMRGRALMLNLVIGGMGGLFCGLLTRTFTASSPFGMEGWRSTMLVGAIATLICAIAVLFLPESPRWLAARHQIGRALRELGRFERMAIPFRWAAAVEPAGATRDGALATARSTDVTPAKVTLWNSVYRWRIMLVVALQFAIPWSTASFAGFIGWVLTRRGYSLADALLLQGVLTVGVSAGAVLSMIFIDRIRRTTLLIWSGFAIAGASVAFTSSYMLAVAVVAGTAIAMVGGIHSWVLMLYSAELFPPLLRGRATTLAYAVNRGASIAVPLVILPVLTSVGETGMFMIMAGAMIASSICLMVVLGLMRHKHIVL